MASETPRRISDRGPRRDGIAMALKVPLKIVLHAGDIVVAESDDGALWRRVLAAITERPRAPVDTAPPAADDAPDDAMVAPSAPESARSDATAGPRAPASAA